MNIFGGLSQKQNTISSGGKVSEKISEIARTAASEGAVLLINRQMLPLPAGTKVSVFGRVQVDWFYTGYGSGGDVNRPYSVNLIDGIRNNADIVLNEKLAAVYEKWCRENTINHGVWGHWPRFYPDMKLSEELVKEAAQESDCAIFVIGRSSGEDRENVLEKGSYYITDEELQNLRLITSVFSKTAVILNIGSIMDMSFLENVDVDAVLIAWQGGMESGNAVADLLSGKENPSGKLSDTIVKKYEYYPCANDFGAKEYNNYREDIYVGYRYFETFRKDHVLFPFGFGLSYTDFSWSFKECRSTENGFDFVCTVKNTGETYCGKEVLQCYVEKPCGNLDNPSRELVSFKKTVNLAPGEEEEIVLSVNRQQLASYDQTGVTGFASAYVLQKGKYRFFIGTDVRNAESCFEYTQEENELIEQLSPVSQLQKSFKIISAEEKDGERVLCEKDAPITQTHLKEKIIKNLPKDIPYTGDKGLKLSDVKNGKCTMEEFVAQLNKKELEAISRGDYKMDSPLGAKGNAGALGGVLPSLREKGVPAVITTDGPSGIRLRSSCSLIPIGTLLACTFNSELVENLYEQVGIEMLQRGSHILLAPGMNIHRSPLCGRNFEYYSEDPFLTGIIAAGAVKGLQKTGVSSCPKHFACNNQEYNRNYNDSRVTERALREIYLKGFEICVKTAHPQNIMTSYNKVNGVWSHYNYELCTQVLRDEWGYEGNVMTDWWMRSSHSPEFPKIRNNAYRVRSQVDVLMPGGKRVGFRIPDRTLLETLGKEGGITWGELQRTAMNVLRFAMNSAAMEK